MKTAVFALCLCSFAATAAPLDEATKRERERVLLEARRSAVLLIHYAEACIGELLKYGFNTPTDACPLMELFSKKVEMHDDALRATPQGDADLDALRGEFLLSAKGVRGNVSKARALKAAHRELLLERLAADGEEGVR